MRQHAVDSFGQPNKSVTCASNERQVRKKDKEALAVASKAAAISK